MGPFWRILVFVELFFVEFRVGLEDGRRKKEECGRCFNEALSPKLQAVDSLDIR